MGKKKNGDGSRRGGKIRGALEQRGSRPGGLQTGEANTCAGLFNPNDASYGAAREARSPITDAEFRKGIFIIYMKK